MIIKPFYLFFAFITFCSCTKENEHEEKNIILEDKKLPRLDYSNGSYWFCMDLDTALAHPLEVKTLYLRDTLPGNSLPMAIKSLKNLTNLELSTIPSSSIESALKIIKDLDSLKILSIYNEIPDLNGEIKNFDKLKELKLYDTGIKEFPVSFLEEMKVNKLIIAEDSFRFIGQIKREGVSAIKELQLKGYKEDTLNSNIYKLTSLQKLNIKSDHLRYISNDIKKLRELEELNIAMTPIANDYEQIKRLNEFASWKCIIINRSHPHE